jgi:hypothetical protein
MMGFVDDDVSGKTEKRDLHQSGPEEPGGDESDASDDEDALHGRHFGGKSHPTHSRD